MNFAAIVKSYIFFEFAKNNKMKLPKNIPPYSPFEKERGATRRAHLRAPLHPHSRRSVPLMVSPIPTKNTTGGNPWK